MSNIVIVQPKQVYVAAASSELQRAEGAIQALRDLGHTVVHDWPAEVRRVGSANPTDAAYVSRRKWAIQDFDGVMSCQVFWLLMPHAEGFGAGVELGYALGMKYPAPRIIVSGPYRRSIFTALVTECYPTDVAALEAEFMPQEGRSNG